MEKFTVGRRQAYYELFKACRLCGSGGGYKMPIVQTASSAGDNEPELRHKIRDCCSIDVHPDDKMPPLICELCVDKVNDFYEFREMCRATNSKVRVSLGLPPQNLNQDLSEDCILGVSGPLIFNSKELEMSQNITHRPIKLKVSLKDIRSPKILSSGPSPPPEKRSVKKENTKFDNQSLLSERLTKRKRGSDPSPSNSVPIKKLRFSDLPGKSVASNKTEKRINTNEQAKKSKELPAKKVAFSPHFCDICKTSFTKSFSLRQHLITQHSPCIIPERLGCAPCHEWFPSVKLAEEHHRWHKNTSTFYNCERCSTKFKVLHGYTRHFILKQCIPEEKVPDVVCPNCQKSFATNYLMELHKCSGPMFSGHCSKCKKHFLKRISLKKHESMCKRLSASPQVNPNNPYLKALKPIQISMSKCDELLEQIKREPVDDDDVNPIYDVSRLSDLPGIMVKSEPPEFGFNDSCDMDIKHEIKEEYPDYNCDYGDGAQNDYSSDGSVSDAENSQFPNLVINPFARKNNTQVESLSFISLRSIFSNKMFKNKSRLKKRIPKTEKSDSKSVFDSLLQESNNHEKKDQPAREIQDSTSSNVETSVSVQNMENSESELNLNIDKNVDVNSTSLTNDENVAKDNENSVENINCHTVNETGVSNDFDNTNVLDRITITSVQGNTSINFENDSGKVCDDEISSVFDQTPLEENNQNKEKSPNFDILETTLLSNDTAKSEDSNNVELPQSDNVTDSVCNLINKSSMDVDIDFDIDSVLQDDLNLPTMKESSKNEIYETQKNSDDMNSATNLSKPSEDPDMEYEMQEKKDGLNSDENLPKSSDDPSMDNETQNKSDDSISAENMLKPSEDLNMDYETQNKSDGLISVEDLLKPSEDLNMVYETQNKSDDLNSSENLLKPSEDLSMDYEIQKNSDDDGTNLNKLVNNEISSNILASTNNSLKNLHDARLQDVIDKSESDILDLVSDSGDDCNIIDSPEKLKALEDQLLSDEINDEKVHEIETASSTISQNNGSLGAQNFSEYDVATNEPKLENGTLLEIENKMTEESLDPQINLGVIQERNSVLEKLNSSATHSNFSNIDASINQSNASDIDKFSDDINIDGALNDMNTDKPVDSLTH